MGNERIVGGKFSIKDTDEALRRLSGKAGFLLAAEKRGQGEELSAEEKFFEGLYPELEKLFYQIRGKGILEGYVRD